MSVDPAARTAAMTALWETGRRAWPGLALEAEAFVRWLDARLDPAQDPAVLSAADLVITAACLLGVPDAARRFIDRYRAEAEKHLRRVAPRPDVVAELLQELWVQLLTPGPDGQPPKVAQYSGRGPLEAWIRVTVVRRGLDQARGQKKTVDFEEVAFEQAAAADPELSVLRRQHHEAIGAIFREATAATPREDRTLLRLHYVDGATLNELAVLYKTSRSGIHRKVEGARAALMERIAALVRDRFAIGDSQRGSMLRIFQSDLRENLALLLKDRG